MTVTVGSCVTSATTTVTVNVLPVLTSMTPDQLALGQPAFTLTVTGSAFDASAVVTFNGVDMTTTYVSATTLTAAVPASAVTSAGTYPVLVRNSTGCTSNVLSFTVSAPPAVWVDDNWVGLAPGAMVSVTVPSAGNHYIGYDAFATVQGGIDAVANPGTEYVLPGTYQERLQISKSVNIRGPNADLNPNTPGAWGPEAILDSKSHGVALDFLKTGSSGTVLNGLTWRQEDAANIILSKWSGINDVVIRDNWFDTNVSSAIELQGGFSGTNWSILDNKVTTVTGGGPAFNLYNLSSSTVSGNSATNTASGFLLTSVTNTQVNSNTFSGIGGVNIQINAGCGNLTVDGNSVTGNGSTSTGIELYSGTTGTNNINHNAIHGCAAGVAVPASQAVGSNVHVNNNDLSNNTYGANNAGTGNLDATCNWWGDATGPRHASNPAATASNSMVSSNVTFVGWSTVPPPAFNCDGCIAPVPEITGDSSNTCPAVTVVLSTAPGMTNYQWNAGGTPIPGATGPTYTVAATGSYTVTYTNGSGCTGTSQAHSVTISACPVPPETAPGNTPATAQYWPDKATQAWPPNSLATSYRVYRGTLADLPALLTSSVDSCTRYEGPDTSIPVTDDPSSVTGRFYWYLVTGSNGSGEGTAGDATTQTRIVNSSGACSP